MIALHGWGKAVGFADKASSFPDPIGLGSELSLLLVVAAEVFFAGLLVLGFLTRFACLPLIIAMVVAVFIHHSGDPMKVKELGLVYLLSYLALLISGAGHYSVDRCIRKKYYL